ncbi:MAG TPA: hypothetical protein VIJ15_11645, partial [Dermatophilaceae bacterium]
LLEDLKEHPAVRPMIKGGRTVEYSAHLVREDGWRGVPRRLTREGFLVTGEAAGFVLNLGYTVRGMDLALVSGVAAAEAVISGGDLEVGYRQALDRTGLPATMRASGGYPDLLHLPALYLSYPGLALDVAESLFRVDGSLPSPIRHKVKAAMRKNKIPLHTALHDGFVGLRSI